MKRTTNIQGLWPMATKLTKWHHPSRSPARILNVLLKFNLCACYQGKLPREKALAVDITVL